ncbi:MAG: acyl-CoA dehydrogenase family protein, partial [Desulfobacterales bacterium]|nr:acyl-CoA dehydrogenase family protein [Desulfobacterales bacterium]
MPLEQQASQELEMFRASVRKFMATEVAPHRDRWRKQGLVDRAAWQAAGKCGLLLTSLPVEYGGGGGDFRHEAVIIEELARIAFLDFSIYLHSVVVAPYIHDCGTQAQRERWLPRMATGDCIGAIAMSEPSTGSDLRAIKTTATPVGDGFVIRGQKTFISNGALADIVIVACKTRVESVEGVTLFVVERGTPGFEIGRHLEKVGRQAQDTVELFFDDVKVTKDHILGEINGGLRLLMSKLGSERLLIATKAVAAMEVALGETIAYAKQREVFGKKVMDFQNTKFKLAEAATQVEVARVFLNNCVDELVGGTLTDTKAAMAKL